MKNIKEVFIKIFQDDKNFLKFLTGFLVFGITSLVAMLSNLNPGGSVVKISYSDLDGYKDGSWREILILPFSVLVSLVIFLVISLRVHRENGRNPARVVLVMGVISIAIIVLVFFRLSLER